MVVKYIGRDCELSTTGVKPNGHAMSAWAVVQAVLRQIAPVFQDYGGTVWSPNTARRDGYQGSVYSIDCLRNWASNGQCYYSDMGHVEACTAPTAHPRQFAAQCISTLLVVGEARQRAQAQADEGVRYSLSASNADVFDPAVSWGTHLNVSVSSPLWEDLCLYHAHPAVLGFVASAIAAAVPFFGAGYLLPMKDGAAVYSLSGRAHHLSRIKTLSTTDAFRRGLLNTRREPHGADQDRLHLIGFDYAILGAAPLCSLVQCVLAAAEEGYCGLNLFDPVRALRTWSWSLDLKTGRLPAVATLTDGRKTTLPAYVRELAETLLKMCRGGLITEETAPDAADLLPKIVELTHDAEQGRLDRCARHLDWAAKLMYLVGGKYEWGSPAARLADHDFANVDWKHGALWQLWDRELVDPLVSMDDVRACLSEGPPETRAWARGEIIRKFAERISGVDWSHVELCRDSDRWRPRLRVEMPHLDSLNRQSFEPVIRRVRDVEQLERLLEQNGRGATRQSDPLVDVANHLALAASTADDKNRRECK